MIPARLNDPETLGELVARYLADDCSAADVSALSVALERDPVAAGLFVEIATQAAIVRDWARTTPPIVEVSSPQSRRTLLPWWLAVAASICLMVVVGRQWSAFDAERHLGLGRIEATSAFVRYAHGGRTTTLDIGDAFAAGTLGTDFMETAVVRLLDGTVLALGPDTELELADEGRKRVVLLRGTFNANVVPQPAGRPMTIRTPTAELEVVGTSFSLAAEPDRTHLDVDKGLVRIRRLTDDAAVEVPAGREVRVSPDASAPLQLAASTRSSDEWHVDFAAGPPVGWSTGEWVPERGSLRAVQLREGSRSRAVVSNNAWQDGDHSLARVHHDSVVRITVRCRTPASLAVVLSLREADAGPFVSNIFGRILCGEAEPLSDGWQTLEIPLSEFTPMRSAKSVEFGQSCVFKMSVATKQERAGLEVRSLQIVRRPPSGSSRLTTPSSPEEHPSS